MLIRIAVICAVLFLGSCLIARQIALSKNHRPEIIIAAGIIVGAIVFAGLWTVSLVYQPLYTKIAGAVASGRDAGPRRLDSSRTKTEMTHWQSDTYA